VCGVGLCWFVFVRVVFSVCRYGCGMLVFMMCELVCGVRVCACVYVCVICTWSVSLCVGVV